MTTRFCIRPWASIEAFSSSMPSLVAVRRALRGDFASLAMAIRCGCAVVDSVLVITFSIDVSWLMEPAGEGVRPPVSGSGGVRLLGFLAGLGVGLHLGYYPAVRLIEQL